MGISAIMQWAWQLAAAEAAAAQAEQIEPEHFLAALTKLHQFSARELVAYLDAEGVDLSMHGPEMELVARVLEEVGIDPDALRHALRDRLGQGRHEHRAGETIHRSERSRKLFARAAALARELKSGPLKCGHLFLAILEERDSTGCRLLEEEGADLKALADRVRRRLEKEPVRDPPGAARDEAPQEQRLGTPFLDRYGRDLTDCARRGELGPIIGRRKEILQVIQTLARRSKNNPVLVGEAGVGKTELARSLEEKYQKKLLLTEDAADLIVAQGYSEEYGVRHLRRTVQALIEAPLSRLILSGELNDWPAVEVAADNDRLVLRPAAEAASGGGAGLSGERIAAVCCECGCAIADADRPQCAWIGGMFICAPCKAKVEAMASPPPSRKSS